MGEWLLLALVIIAVALAVAWPLLSGRPTAAGEAAGDSPADAEREALLVRHRLAIEALRDVEADHRSGSLDDEAYARERADAEAHAARTLAALDAARASATPVATRRSGWPLPAAIGAVLIGLVVAGFALPHPYGIAERDARVERLRTLTEAVAANPRDAAALSELADLYLATGTPEDVGKALAALLLLRDATPDDPNAHERLVTLLIGAGLWDEATAATDRYAEVVTADEPTLPFFRGIIALRGDGDPAEAIRQFDRFLELAPDDPRATMIRGLRDEAVAQRDGS